ncbi:MAG TPA: hypothetical protein VHZ95_04005, partial [Polyangiales bacterium]|nr:hypothetical protein [Polyangiales bacterium]
MSGTCARCGRALSEPTESCDCAAVAPAAKAPRWGTLDIKLGDLQLPKPRAANVTAPLDQAAMVPRVDLAAGARVARGDTAPIAAQAIAQRAPSVIGAPEPIAKRADSAPLANARASAARRPESTKLDASAPRARRAHDGPTVPLDPRVAGPRHPALRNAEAQHPALRNAEAQHPALRNAEAQHPALRNAEAQHPALRGSAPQHPALRGSSPRTARAASRPISRPLDRPQESSADPTTFGERFGDDGPLDIGSALEIESTAAPHESEAPAPSAPQMTSQPAAPSPAMQLAELSGYGAPPQKLLQTVPYFFRVSSRKRSLQAQLSAQSR